MQFYLHLLSLILLVLAAAFPSTFFYAAAIVWLLNASLLFLNLLQAMLLYRRHILANG